MDPFFDCVVSIVCPKRPVRDLSDQLELLFHSLELEGNLLGYGGLWRSFLDSIT